MATHREELEIEKIRAEINRMISESNKIASEINKMAAETAKINSENRYYPIIVTAGATGAIIALTKLFL